MANVVRFVLDNARNLHVPGAGQFRAGVLDVDANNLAAVARARYLVQPYRAVELGIVDSATPPPALPAAPGSVTPTPDPYSQYLLPGELAPAMATVAQGDNAFTTAQRVAFVAARPLHLIFDGDSITEGAGATFGRTYPVQTVEGMDARTIVRNFGVGGQTVTQMLNDAATQIDPLFDPTRTNVVAALGGTNDLSYFSGTRPVETIYGDIVAYHQGRQAAGFKTVALTILPNNHPDVQPNFEDKRQQINALIRANWQTFADALADIGNDPTIGAPGAANGAYFADKIHPNNAGYAILARIVRAALGTLGVVGAHDHPQYDATTEVFIPAPAFDVKAGAPVKAFRGTLPEWQFDPATAATIATGVNIPRGWQSFDIDILWGNAGAGTGAVRWIAYYNATNLPGGSYGAQTLASTFIADTAGANGNTQESRPPITGGVVPTPGAPVAIHVMRDAANAADTLPNICAFLGVWLRKRS